MAVSASAQALHQAAVDDFIRLNLSYRFTATLMNPAAPSPRIRFLFSKPEAKKPEPEITVAVDLEVVSVEGSVVTYALHFEGQKYRRVISMDRSRVTGKEFNELLLDKVFDQKAVTRQHQLWVAEVK